MIVATKSVDALLKGVVSPDKLMISRIDSISKSIQLDPNISTPKKELFVVSGDDIKNPKVRKEFVESVRSKHPECLIMYISKNGRLLPDIEPEMFDSYLSKPKHSDVRDAFITLVEEAEAKAQFKPQDTISTPEEFHLEEPKSDEATASEEPKEPEEEPVISLTVPEESKTEEPEPEDRPINLVERIRRADTMAALTAVVGEVNASKVVREVAEANATFKQSEAYVSALYENINAIMSNPDYDTSTKLSKVHAILCDKAYLKAKTNSIIEQTVEQIISVIIEKAKSEVEVKTQEMDEKILAAFSKKASEDAPNVRLATIIENRARVLLELETLDLEIKNMATTCTNTINDTVDGIISDSSSTTGSPILDSQMKARFGDIAPENLLIVLDNLFKNGQDVSEQFGEMSKAVNSTIRKLYSLLAYYKEETEVLGETIRFMKANNVESTVVANTIMKKSCRLFINNGDFDSVAITYILSKYQSRKNDNVMLLDLTGSNVFGMFGIRTMKYSDIFETEKFSDKFLIASTFGDVGISLQTEEDFQRLSTRLLHYAKHYSRINIICTPEQQNIIDSFKNDVLSITYMVDCYPTTISRMAECISKSQVDNTATRVVLVNYISDSSKICSDLGIMERYDMQLATCEPITEIRYCSLHNQDPFEVESILNDVGGVLRTC